MDKITKYGFFVLIAVIIAILMLRGESDESKLYLDTLHERLEAQDEIISRLTEENGRITVDLDLKADSISALAVERDEIKAQRRAAIIYYEKRISNIDNLTTSELDSFFIARYQGRRDTSEVDRH